MAKLSELKKYLNYEFSTGVYTGDDYKTFQNKYINYLRSICKDNGWQLINVGRNHYTFSAFITDNENHFIYLSISDVRFFQNEWFNHVLIRTAKSEKDYTGGSNKYYSLPVLQFAIHQLLQGA